MLINYAHITIGDRVDVHERVPGGPLHYSWQVGFITLNTVPVEQSTRAALGYAYSSCGGLWESVRYS